MFDYNNNTQSSNYEHSTKRADWEYLLDELFLRVIHSSKVGVAVISNTAKSNEGDLTGEFASQLNFRIENDQPTAVKEDIRQLSFRQFEQIFAVREKMKPAFFDCYRVKKPALLNNTLIYFVEQGYKKAILVFSLPLSHRLLSKYVKTISNILSAPEKTKLAAKGPTPRSFSVHQFSTTKLHLLRERLDYLESLDILSAKETREMRALEEFLLREMSEIF